MQHMLLLCARIAADSWLEQGVGPATASGVLAAAAPVPFMSDEACAVLPKGLKEYSLEALQSLTELLHAKAAQLSSEGTSAAFAGFSTYSLSHFTLQAGLGACMRWSRLCGQRPTALVSCAAPADCSARKERPPDSTGVGCRPCCQQQARPFTCCSSTGCQARQAAEG